LSFPYISSKGFESGTVTDEFDGETDTQGKLEVIDFKRMFKKYGLLPYSGAYCAHADLSIGTQTTDGYFNEDDDFDMTSDSTVRYVGFAFAMLSGFTMATNDRFSVFSIQASTTEHVIVDVLYDGTDILLGAAQNNSGTVRNRVITLDEWHWVDLHLDYDGAGGSDGFINVFIDGGRVGTTLGSLTQAASTVAWFGLMNLDSGSTVGHIFLDNLTFDDVDRIRPYQGHTPQGLFPVSGRHWIDGRRHSIVGPGIADIQLTGTSTDADLLVYDSDQGLLDRSPELIAHIRGADDTLSRPYRVKYNKGLHLVPSGTGPQGWVDVVESSTATAGALKSYAMRN
jgi:hypothetical protein